MPDIDDRRSRRVLDVLVRRSNLVRLVAVAIACCAACEVGEIGGSGDPEGPDLPDAAGAVPDAAGVAVQCRDTIANVGGGEHNPGQACLAGGCHGPGGEGPRFTLGGTLYTTIAGGTPNSRATITVRDANGAMLDLPTMQNGNFYTAQAVAYPVTVYASECPGAMPMISPAASGDCNTGGCHAAAGGAGRVYLP